MDEVLVIAKICLPPFSFVLIVIIIMIIIITIIIYIYFFLYFFVIPPDSYYIDSLNHFHKKFDTITASSIVAAITVVVV